MSLLEKIKAIKKQEQNNSNNGGDTKREETKDNMAMNSFEEMRAKLRAKLQETENKKAETVEPETKVKEDSANDKPAEKKPIKLNVDSIKAKLLAKSTAGVKLPPITTEQSKDDMENNENPPANDKQDNTKEQENVIPAEPEKTEKTEETSPEEKKSVKKTRKPRAKKSKETVVPDGESSVDLDNTVDDACDYDAMSQVITEHYTTKEFEDMIEDFSNRIKNVRIESDMNLGVFKVAQTELVNLRDEVALEHSKAAYALESAAAMVKKITDKNIGIGSSADERRANVAKALANAVVDGVSIDITFCHSVAKLREQAISHLLERIDAKLKACITMSAVLKMEQASC